MRKKILITDEIAPEGLKLLQSNPDFDIVYKPGLKADDLKKSEDVPKDVLTMLSRLPEILDVRYVAV